MQFDKQWKISAAAAAQRTEKRPGTKPRPAGPWDNEPDKAQWKDKETGLDCLIVRNHMGALCGYVGVPPGHPAHGRRYSEVLVDCHGGLTFTGSCEPGIDDTVGICHLAEPGAPEPWWLGFDCAHAGDLIPSMQAYLSMSDGTYRDIEYVAEECRQLAAQLVKLKPDDLPEPDDEPHVSFSDLPKAPSAPKPEEEGGT